MSYPKLLHNDTVFNEINKNFVSLQPDIKKQNNSYLDEVVCAFIEKMKSCDPLFKVAFRRFVYTGSYYKGTKITTPEEYDLNLVIKLPVNYNSLQFGSDVPGYIWIQQTTKLHLETKAPINIRLKTFSPPIVKRKRWSFLNKESFLDHDRLHRWIQSIISKIMSQLICENRKYILHGKSGRTYKITINKSGPAFTLHVETPTGTHISVDLVPVLEFLQLLPIEPKLLCLFERQKNWFAVPKPDDMIKNKNIYWRLSFSDQEKWLLSLNGHIKPVIRQMKKLRDTQNWTSIKSYFIETLFYNMLFKSNYILPKSATIMFFEMLKCLHEAVSQHRLDYFWNNNLNLFKNIYAPEMENIKYRLSRIILDIERNMEHDPFVIAKYILTPQELNYLRNNTADTGHDRENNVFLSTHSAQVSHVNNEQKNDQGWCRII